jgi:hypothetical protein
VFSRIRSQLLGPWKAKPIPQGHASCSAPSLLFTFYIHTRHCAGEARAVHLHFVQSLEPLQGAGLGQAALSLHLAMRGAPGEGHAVDGIRSEAENQGTGLGEQRERTQKETHGRSAESPCVSREGLEVKGLEWIGLGWGGEREEGVRI